jgi:hypothetical protein
MFPKQLARRFLLSPVKAKVKKCWGDRSLSQMFQHHSRVLSYSVRTHHISDPQPGCSEFVLLNLQCPPTLQYCTTLRYYCRKGSLCEGGVVWECKPRG